MGHPAVIASRLHLAARQVSAATVCATWSAAPTAESASQTAPTATSASARSASGEHFARRVSQHNCPFPHTYTRRAHACLFLTRGVLCRCESRK